MGLVLRYPSDDCHEAFLYENNNPNLIAGLYCAGYHVHVVSKVQSGLCVRYKAYDS